MRSTLTFGVAASLLWLSLAAAQTKKSSAPPARKTTTAAGKTSTAKKSTAKTSAARKGATRKSAPRRPAVTWRNRQTVPSPERYREIQGALAERGFLPADQATGTWTQASTDALKRFQQEQNLDATGKVDSLSLIALGLGPKRDAAVVVPKPQDLPAAQPPIDR